MTATVAELSIAPVKGLRVTRVEAVELGPRGAAGDRAFLVLDAADGSLLLTTRTPRLLQVAAERDAATGALVLRFPDGRAVTEVPEPGEAAATASYDGRAIRGRLVRGTLTAALSEHLGRELVLLARDEDELGADDAPVTLASTASLAALAPALGGEPPDGRRFRMTITAAGLDAWEEHGWAGRELAAGEAVLRVRAPVPRCAVTTRHPEDGRRDVPTLKALAELRGKRDVTFGVWCDVLSPGTVRTGDPIALA
jgi:uncharacterized protein YcbX